MALFLFKGGIMKFLADNWSLLVLILALIVYFAFVSKKNVMEWLLYAVIEAEKYYKGGTGRLKLVAVYNDFCERFPVFATIISFALFSKMVDDALVEMKRLIEFNGNISRYITEEDE